MISTPKHVSKHRKRQYFGRSLLAMRETQCFGCFGPLAMQPAHSYINRRRGQSARPPEKVTNMNTPTKTRPNSRKGAPGRPGPVRAAVAVAIGAAVVLSATPLSAQTAWQSNGGRAGGGGGYSAPLRSVLSSMTFILHVAKETNR